jgi:predicted transcriptional regulator
MPTNLGEGQKMAIEETAVVEFTAEIVSAYVAKNAVPVAGLADLIANVSGALRKVGDASSSVEEAKAVPAVSPKKSVHPDYIVCLEDGKKFKSLKRHLSLHGLTPGEYRTKWDLKDDYPMVAPNYAAARSELAIKSGLGRKPAAKPKGRSATKAK